MTSSIKDNIRDGMDVIRDTFNSLSRDNGCLFVIAVFTILFLPQAFIMVNDLGLISAFETDAGSHIDAIKSLLSSYNMNEGYHSKYYGWTFFAVNFFVLWPFSKLTMIFHIRNMQYMYFTIRIILFIFGLLSCVLWYRILRILFAGSLIPVAGTLLYIVSPANDSYFYTIHPETTGATFLFLATIYLLAYVRSDNDIRLYYPALACLALSSLSKQIFFFNSLPILFGFFHLMCRKRNISYSAFFFSRDFLIYVGVSICLSLAIFFVIHPFAFLDFKSFVGYQFDLTDMTSGEYTTSVHKALIEWVHSLFSTNALPIVISGVLIPAGLAVSIISYVRRRDDRTFLFIVLCGTIIYMGALVVVFNREYFAVEYFSPVYPMCILVMMSTLYWVLDIPVKWLKFIMTGASCYFIAFIFLINSLDVSQALLTRLQYKDSIAYKSYDYIVHNFDNKDRIAYDNFVGMPEDMEETTCHYWRGCGEDYIETYAPDIVMFNEDNEVNGQKYKETDRLARYVVDHNLKLIAKVTGTDGPGTATVSVYKK